MTKLTHAQRFERAVIRVLADYIGREVLATDELVREWLADLVTRSASSSWAREHRDWIAANVEECVQIVGRLR